MQLRVQGSIEVRMLWISDVVDRRAEHALVDEYGLLVYPLVLGSGKKVFADGVYLNLQLTESRPFPSGVVLMRYASERPA